VIMQATTHSRVGERNDARAGERHAELQAAFLAFGSVSTQLADVFDALRDEVSKLRGELGVAHADKEHLAARLSALLHALPAGVLVLGARGDIEECNPAARDWLGEPLIGQTFAAVLGRAAVDAERLHEHIELRSGRFVTFSRRELDRGGEVVLIADVTEPHLMQVLVARQQRLLTLGELAAGLAHQIRTPLAAALLYASQMQLPHRTDADQARCADKTVASLEQLSKLVTDMLAFTHGGPAREVVHVGAVLEQVAQWLRPALRTGVTLTIRTEAPALAVRADLGRIESRHQFAAVGRRGPQPRAARAARRGGPGRNRRQR
jgi:two-component system sensor histidine kinase FlrB